MSNNITNVNMDELRIYEGGNLIEIKVDDLLNNETAIRQLLNTYHIKLNEIKTKDKDILDLNTSLEYHKTTPFMAIVAMLVNLVGSTIIALSANLLTLTNSPSYSGWLLGAGIFLVVIGSLSTILFPYARKWFNKGKK